MAASSDPDSDVAGEIRDVGGDTIAGPIGVIQDSAGDRLATATWRDSGAKI